MILLKFTCSITFFLLVSCQSYGSNVPYLLSKDANYYVVPFKHITFLEDSTKALQFEDIQSNDVQAYFTSYKSYYQVDDFEKAWWFKFSLKNISGNFMDWKMYVGFNNIIDLYLEDENGKITHKKGGQYMPSSQRDVVEGRISAFNLKLDPGEAITIYTRIENINHRIPYFEPVVINSRYWNKSLQKRNLNEGLFYGIMLIMVFYNAFIFLSYRDKTYLFYAAYIFNVAFYFFVLKGFTREYIFSENPQLEAYGWQISLGLSPIFYFQFIRTYLNLKELIPHWDKLIKYAVRICIIVLVVQIAITYFTFNIQLVGRIAYFILISQAIFSLILLSILVKTKNKLAYYIAAGSLCLWTGGIVGLYFTITAYFLDGLVYGQYGIIAEVLIFSLGLGYKMREAKTEKEQAQKALIDQLTQNEQLQLQANQVLESKVVERTKALQHKTIELERKNEEVTSQRDLLELQKKEIEEKRNLLLQLNEDKNHLIGIVAHDLRNPLATALSMSELIKSESENLDEDQTSSISLISRSLTRMNEMVEKILDLRAIEAKKINIRFEKTDISLLITQVVESFKSRARKKSIQLFLETVPAKIAVDKSYLIQILENLISNALKFSETHTTVYIKLLNSHEKLRIEVKDHGPGLTEDDKKKLFGKFQKLSAKPTKGEPSTGLGLSIVKKYVDAMKGDIWCESTHGKGATFIVELTKKSKQNDV